MSEVYSLLSKWCKAESEIDGMATDMATDLGGRYCGALETKSVSASVSVRVMCLCVPFCICVLCTSGMCTQPRRVPCLFLLRHCDR